MRVPSAFRTNLPIGKRARTCASEFGYSWVIPIAALLRVRQEVTWRPCYCERKMSAGMPLERFQRRTTR
jgi:hypothetical protein